MESVLPMQADKKGEADRQTDTQWLWDWPSSPREYVRQHTLTHCVCFGTQLLKLQMRTTKNWQCKNVSKGWRNGKLKALAAFPQALSSTPNNYMVAYNYL